MISGGLKPQRETWETEGFRTSTIVCWISVDKNNTPQVLKLMFQRCCWDGEKNMFVRRFAVKNKISNAYEPKVVGEIGAFQRNSK